MPQLLIVGCGFVGKRLALLARARGWEPLCWVRSPESRERLASEGLDVIAADASDPAVWDAAALQLCGVDAAVHCASSSGGDPEDYRQVYLEGTRCLSRLAATASLVFTSSTSVYGQDDGEWVEETSPTEPPTETGRVLLEAEQVILDRGGAVARVAGIYGLGRSHTLNKVARGQASLDGEGTRWMNHAWVDDVAAALFQLATHRSAGVWNVCDSRPVQQVELYHFLAEKMGLPKPVSGSDTRSGKRGLTSKRVSNAKLISSGFHPSRPDCFAGYSELLTPFLAQKS